ncbi:MAG TPA: alpha/beta hydrolase [Acidimicrobiales bacterium]|nr:alpha/beta hydrolase [Acidimicrobiales bacterium]
MDDATGRAFVLIHGGGHGGWCWQRVARRLRAQGQDAYAPTLTGFGERSHLPAPDFETFVTDIANVIAFEDLHDVVLVGHSMGGTIVPRVAEAVTERIAAAVWLAAVVTNDGESLIQAVPQSPWIARAVTLGPDGTAHTDPDLILDANIHDGTPEQRAFVHDRHLPYPPHALVEPGRLTAFLALGIPTAYVVATDDRTIEPHIAARFADRLPGCHRADVPGGHDCMITQPDAVTAALIAVTS